MKVIWSPLAEQRAGEAVDFIARDRPQAAAQWLEKLIASVAGLADFPKRGRPVPEIGKPNYRQIVHYPYRMIYRVDEDRVAVLTVRHGRRDWNPREVKP